MRFHVVGLPYAPTRKEYSACAFTSRAFKFCTIMTSLGHQVFHYGAEGSNPPCEKHFNILSTEERISFFGKENSSRIYYTTNPVEWNSNKLYWQETNRKAAYQIGKNIKSKDFVCIIGGNCQKPLIESIPECRDRIALAVEYGIGYTGTFCKFRAFDSYAHMHRMYGREGIDPNGNNFDAVIPCPYDPNDFSLQENPEDYFIFVGRIIERKGIDIACDAARIAGVKLRIAGQGVIKTDGNKIYAEDGKIYSGEYVGYVNSDTRNQWMRNAKAILVPTKYLEPFGGVNVEAQFCGTPVIAPDFGAFTETVQHGFSGYRCRTLEQYIWAINNVSKLNRKVIRERAINLYSLERVGKMYEEWFSMLSTLWGKGWYEIKERNQLDWLK